MSARAVPIKPSAVASADLQQLHESYDLRNPEEIATFLAAHPGLAPLLVEARRQIDHYFAPGVPVSISHETDPEDGDQSLFAVIRTGVSIEQDHQRLYRFWDEWLDNQDPNLGWLIVFATL